MSSLSDTTQTLLRYALYVYCITEGSTVFAGKVHMYTFIKVTNCKM